MTSRAGRRSTIGVVLLTLLFSSACRRGNRHTAAPGETSSNLASVRTVSAPSCRNLAATCGPSGNDDCCKSLLVPGGTFFRSYDGLDYVEKVSPATVSDFYLDKYEVTVGRFRVFVNAGMGTQKTPPLTGAGAHPRIPGSGWDPAWNAKLAADSAALKTAHKCFESYQSWTDEPEANESKPINCLDWYTAFAFCAWDGGRLATEAEWNYAASGGDEQRYYPWSSPPSSKIVDDTYTAYCGGTCKSLQNVGSKSPRGDGRWGQSDLGGNAWEWTLDANSPTFPMPCHDCAVIEGGPLRNFRSGAFDDIALTLRSATRHVYHPDYHGIIGVRCARSP